MLDLLELIPLFALAVALAMLLIGRRVPYPVVSTICCFSVVGSFVCALLVRPHEVTVAPWLPLAKADWGLLLDNLSWVMVLVVTGIGLLIHIYSTEYMA